MILEELAKKDNVPYLENLSPSEAFLPFFRTSAPNIFHSFYLHKMCPFEITYRRKEKVISHMLMNQAAILHKGIAPVERNKELYLAVDPIKTPATGTEYTDQDSIEYHLTKEKRKFRFAYASQSEIDNLLAKYVPDFEEKNKLKKEYSEHVEIMRAELQNKIIDALKGKQPLTIPEKFAKNFTDYLEWTYEGVPIHYDDKIWPTYFFLCTTLTATRGIFGNYDNHFKGKHIEQRIGFDMTLDSIGLLYDIIEHLCFCLSNHEIGQLPDNMRKRVLETKKAMIEENMEFKKNPLLTVPVLKELGVVLEQMYEGDDNSYEAVEIEILKKHNLHNFIKQYIPPHFTIDMVDPCLNISRKEKKQFLRNIVKSAGYDIVENCFAHMDELELF